MQKLNILVLSHLTTNVSSGPNWSVPASVKSLSEIDNVLWINKTDAEMPHWNKVSAYHNIKEFDSLDKLPFPFEHPDIVVFEGFYFIDDAIYALKLKQKGIPYIIVPRGSLTLQALHNEAKIKKAIAHFLIFDRFVNGAIAIQYLTKKEREDSTCRFLKDSFVVPNGFDEPMKKKELFSENQFKSVFVGRLSIYHKGIDNLLKAINNIKEQLRNAAFTLNMYGPCRKYDFDAVGDMINEYDISDIVFLNDSISGETKERTLLDADLFVLTSRMEGHPMGLIEALAYGLPCFVSSGSNMKEEIEKFNAGWTCNGEVADIQEALLKVIKEKTQLRRKSEGAKQLALNYKWDNISMQFHEEIKKLI